MPVMLIGIGASAHQAWSANIFTTVSDMFPKKTVASVIGIGGMAGSMSGALVSLLGGVKKNESPPTKCGGLSIG